MRRFLALSLLLVACGAPTAELPPPESAKATAPTAPTAAPAPPAPIPEPKKTPALAPGAAFGVAFEQDDKAVAIADHQVTLAKKPFAVVFTFPGGASSAVHLNASLGARQFDLARSGKPFLLGDSSDENAPFAPGRGMAESVYPRIGNELWIDDGGSLYVYFEGDDDNRCNAFEHGAGGVVTCRRVFSKLAWSEPRRTLAMSAVSKEVYLVFVSVTPGTDAKGFQDREEKQREYVKITWR